MMWEKQCEMARWNGVMRARMMPRIIGDNAFADVGMGHHPKIAAQHLQTA
jgi:hypothetical protein